MVDGNALVVLEDLNTAAMTATARESWRSPVSSSAESGLNRSIQDKGRHSFGEVRDRARRTGAAVAR